MNEGEKREREVMTTEDEVIYKENIKTKQKNEHN